MADFEGQADIPEVLAGEEDFLLATEPERKTKDKGEGWQTVTSRSRQRKDTGKSSDKGSTGKSAGPAVKSAGESSVFASLEDEARQRRAKIEASKAEQQDAERGGGGNDTEEDDSEGEGKGEGAAPAAAEEEKKKKKREKKPKVTVAEAASKVDVEELSAFLIQIGESFANVPDVQLMRCTDFFARAFSGVTPSLVSIPKISKDASMAKAIEVPLADVPEAVVTATADWLAARPAEELGKFLLLLISAAMEEIVPAGKTAVPKGQQPVAPPKAKVGMLVVLAILLRKKPDVMLQQADAVRSNSSFHTQDRLPLLAWIYGQVAQADLVLGMALWVKNLLPLCEGKASSPVSRDVALTFLETVIAKNLKKARSVLINGAVRKGERLVPPASLDLFLRLSFPPADLRTKATERFTGSYQLIKDIALAGSARGKTTKAAALQLFPLALKATAQESSREEACSLVLWCLRENHDCFKQWERHHLEDLAGSVSVLQYLLRSWLEVKGQLEPLQELQSFLLAIRGKHEAELVEEPSSSVAKEIRRADAVARALQGKLSWVPACTKATATIAAIVAIGYGCYLVSPTVNPWGWDGWVILSKTHGLRRVITEFFEQK